MLEHGNGIIKWKFSLGWDKKDKGEEKTRGRAAS